jgi:hypothetical protein
MYGSIQTTVQKTDRDMSDVDAIETKRRVNGHLQHPAQPCRSSRHDPRASYSLRETCFRDEANEGSDASARATSPEIVSETIHAKRSRHMRDHV